MFDMVQLGARERFSWLRLIRSEGIGPVTFGQLLARFGDAETAVRELPALARASGRKSPLTLAPVGVIEQELAHADQLGARYSALCEPDYPDRLRHIPGAPPIVCHIGNLALSQRPCLAIVGARNASAAGRKFTADIVRDLASEGLTIVSGLARGIDGAAHNAALESGTVAVVAGGIDVIYPPEHLELTRDIAARGLILSELPPGHQPKARDFPRRNRIISGLSNGVLVVEAAERSGTLITARYAAEQGREVFAVPGSPLDPRCQGTNRLIRDGAALVQNAEDIMEALKAMTSRISEQPRFAFDHYGAIADANPDEDALPEVRDMLGFTPVHRDLILREASAPAPSVIEALMRLVLGGEAEELDGGYFVLAAGG